MRIIVVDDNSPDGTADVVRNLSERYDHRLDLIERPEKNGLGTAYKEGFRRAIEQGADYVFQMDADLSHAPEYIPEFLMALDNADVVVGSRYTDGGAWTRNGDFEGTPLARLRTLAFAPSSG